MFKEMVGIYLYQYLAFMIDFSLGFCSVCPLTFHFTVTAINWKKCTIIYVYLIAIVSNISNT